MSKHTPGQWIHSLTCDPLHFHSLTTIIAGNVMSGMPQARIDVGGKADITELEANARLIAAAPDLYAVLSELEESCEYWSEYDVPLGIVERIKSALKRARGEQ